MRTASPTSTHSMSVCSETSATPCTTAMGACCPPIASTAIAGICGEHAGRGFGRSSGPGARRGPQTLAQFHSRYAVLERLAPVDQQDGHLVRVPSAQVGVGIDVEDFDNDPAAGGDLFDHCLHFLAEMAVVYCNEGEPHHVRRYNHATGTVAVTLGAPWRPARVGEKVH